MIEGKAVPSHNIVFHLRTEERYESFKEVRGEQGINMTKPSLCMVFRTLIPLNLYLSLDLYLNLPGLICIQNLTPGSSRQECL